MRKKIVCGNWKMNLSAQEGGDLLAALKAGLSAESTTVIVAPPAPYLHMHGAAIAGSGIGLSAQNVASTDNGAFTGEFSANMLSDVGCEYVIIGHSERREYFAEDEEMLLLKVNKALSAGLKVIYCIGEKLAEREANNQESVIKNQLMPLLDSLSENDWKDIILAYEPVWAIGTGKTATPEQAEEVHAFIRNLIEQGLSSETANNTTILYGGSCKPANADDLFAQPNVDGGLIGGASLKSDDFLAIIQSMEKLA